MVFYRNSNEAFPYFDDMFINHCCGDGVVFEHFLDDEFHLSKEVKNEIGSCVIYQFDLGIQWCESFLKNHDVGDYYETYDGECVILEDHHIQYIRNRLRTFKSSLNLIIPIYEDLKKNIEFEEKMVKEDV